MDGVIYKFAQFRNLFRENVIVPDFETASVTRSKAKTYHILNGVVPLPVQYSNIEEVKDYPIFVKPDVGKEALVQRKYILKLSCKSL